MWVVAQVSASSAEVTVVHSPSVPFRSQAWQVPVHAESQQYPSAQFAVMHSVASLQV